MPVGTYNFTVTYSNGSVAKSSLLVPSPGSIEVGSTSYVYTEEYRNASNPPSGYAALPRRADSISANYNSTSSKLTIKFSVTDDKIYNSVVWFYDSKGAYIGTTDWLRSFETASISSTLNSGGALHIDGIVNTLILLESDIKFNDDKKMSDIYSLHIVLADGLQYTSDSDEFYDTRSISEKVSVTTN